MAGNPNIHVRLQSQSSQGDSLVKDMKAEAATNVVMPIHNTLIENYTKISCFNKD